jgi:hypothetical protein
MITEVKKNKTEIKSFLEEVKKVNNRDFRIIRRKIEKEKNPWDFMNKLEYNVDDMINEIKKLSYQDYLRCQIDTENIFIFMYCFIKIIKGFIVFIKLSIVEKDHEIVYVISFHEANKDELMNRPYKEEK